MTPMHRLFVGRLRFAGRTARGRAEWLTRRAGRCKEVESKGFAPVAVYSAARACRIRASRGVGRHAPDKAVRERQHRPFEAQGARRCWA